MISPIRNANFSPSAYGLAPVTNAAPTRDPVKLGVCLNAIVVQGIVAYGCYRAAPQATQYAARLQLVQTISTWYGLDACPSIPYMMAALHNRLLEINMRAQEWIVAPLYLQMVPKAWPWYT